jgi:hypothetical protein
VAQRVQQVQVDIGAFAVGLVGVTRGVPHELHVDVAVGHRAQEQPHGGRALIGIGGQLEHEVAGQIDKEHGLGRARIVGCGEGRICPIGQAFRRLGGGAPRALDHRPHPRGGLGGKGAAIQVDDFQRQYLAIEARVDGRLLGGRRL